MVKVGITLTDDIVREATERMTMWELTPYSIDREEIINRTEKDIVLTVTTPDGGDAAINLPAMSTVDEPKVGMLFRRDGFRMKYGERERLRAVRRSSTHLRVGHSETARQDVGTGPTALGTTR